MTRRLFAPRVLGIAAAVGLAFATAQCGLLGLPGDYASGDDDIDGSTEALPGSDGSAEGASTDAPTDGPARPPIGTLALLAGSRNASSPDDDTWAGDAWQGPLDADGRVSTWQIAKSIPRPGPFDASGLVGGSWVTINAGPDFAGGGNSALQSTTWGPGIVGDWRASRASGAPGGLDDSTRVFFGGHLGYVGGTRTVSFDGGSNTVFTKEVHVSDVDVANNALGASAPAGEQLTVARSRAGVVFGNGMMFVVGGRSGGGPMSSVEVAKVDGAAGTIGPFSEQSAMTTDGADHDVFLPSLVVADGYLFVAGGHTTASMNRATDVVLGAKIDAAAGTLGPFVTLTKLPKALRDFAFVAFKGRLYVAGGFGISLRSDVVFSAKINADGTLGAWDATNARLPSSRSDLVGLAY